MKRELIKSAVEYIAIFCLLAVASVFFIALMRGWEKVSEGIVILVLVVGGFAGIFAILGLLAKIEELYQNSKSGIVRGVAKLIQGIFLVGCLVLVLWLILNYLTDWIWHMPPCNTPGCRYD